MLAAWVPTWTILPLLLLSGIGALTIGTRALDRWNLSSVSPEEAKGACPQRLKEANRELTLLHELERFAHIAAHDLQEPLRDITRYVQLLEARLEDRLVDEERDYMDYAVDGAKRLHMLLNALLRYAEAGEHPPRTDHAHAEEALERALARLGDEVERAGATISHDRLPAVPLAEDELEEVLHELIDNALRHGGKAPHVHVSAVPTGETVRLMVSDDGPGIDTAYHERVFELFEQLDRDTDQPAVGLGLAIVQRIVERHGGEVSLVSDTGEGTTVVLELPKV